MSAFFPVVLAEEISPADVDDGEAIDLEVTGSSLRLWLEGTTAGAAPLTVTVEHSHNGVSWSELGAFDAISEAGAGQKTFPAAMQWVRVSWTGGDGWQFSVAGDQLLRYSTPAKVKLVGARSENFPPEVTDQEVDAAIELADGLIDGYLGTAVTADADPVYTVPLEDWGPDIERASAIITAYDLISARIGYNPAQPTDDPFRKRYEDVIAWLEKIAAGDLTLVGTTPPTPSTTVGRVLTITSEEPRGW